MIDRACGIPERSGNILSCQIRELSDEIVDRISFSDGRDDIAYPNACTTNTRTSAADIRIEHDTRIGIRTSCCSTAHLLVVCQGSLLGTHGDKPIAIASDVNAAAYRLTNLR